jgi:hypothetical protein
MTLPRSITAMRSASWSASSRYCVHSRTGRAVADERADDLPHVVARPRVQAGGGLVEEQQLRGDDDARRDVQAPAHAARVVLDLPARGVLEAEGVEQVPRAGLGLRAPVAEQPAEQDQVLAPGEVLVDRGELPGEADERADGVGVLDDVVAEHAGAALVRREQRGEHADRRRLARAVGAEDAVDGAARDLEVDAVDGPGGAERLAEAVGLDGEGGITDGHAELPGRC